MKKEIVAKLRHLRIAPRKVRLVAGLIRGQQVSRALALLDNAPKRAAQPMAKLLQSAIANAKNNFQLKEDSLYVARIAVDEGPKLKRWRPRAMGRAYGIQKKTSHITLVLSKVKSEKSKVKSQSSKLKVKNKK